MCESEARLKSPIPQYPTPRWSCSTDRRFTAWRVPEEGAPLEKGAPPEGGASPEKGAAGDALCAAEGPKREESPEESPEGRGGSVLGAERLGAESEEKQGTALGGGRAEEEADGEGVWEEREEEWWERQQKWEEANTAAEGAAVLLEELQCLVAAKPIYAMGTCEGFAALGLANGHVVLCSLSPLRELFSFEAHAAAVSVSVRPPGRLQTQHATPYTQAAAQCMHAATVCTQAVELISPSQLLTGDTDGQVALWRLDEAGDDKRRLVRFDGHSGAVAALQGDGDKVVSAARDGTVRVWDVEGGKERFRLQGFTRYVGSLHLTPSRLIADGTNNAVVCLDFAPGPLDGAEPE